jgi:hypothetical protein
MGRPTDSGPGHRRARRPDSSCFSDPIRSSLPEPSGSEVRDLSSKGSLGLLVCLSPVDPSHLYSHSRDPLSGEPRRTSGRFVAGPGMSTVWIPLGHSIWPAAQSPAHRESIPLQGLRGSIYKPCRRAGSPPRVANRGPCSRPLFPGSVPPQGLRPSSAGVWSVRLARDGVRVDLPVRS